MAEIHVLKHTYTGPCEWCGHKITLDEHPGDWTPFPCPHCGKDNLNIPEDAKLWQCACGSTEFRLYRNGCAVCVECKTFNSAVRFEKR